MGRIWVTQVLLDSSKPFLMVQRHYVRRQLKDQGTSYIHPTSHQKSTFSCQYDDCGEEISHICLAWDWNGQTVVYSWLGTSNSLDLIMEDYFSRCSKLCWLRTFTIEEIIGGYSRFPKTQGFSMDWSAGDAFCPMEKDKRWTNEFFLIIWTFSQDFHLENCHIILEPFGIAHLWLTTPVLQDMKRTEWPPPRFFSEDCVFCLPVASTPSMTINTECAFYSTF